jgi:hypothetical protein
METANSGSLVNKYKLDLLWLCLVPAKHLPFCKPLMQRYRNMQGLQKGHWAQILWLFYHLFVKMPIDAVLAMFNFASVNHHLISSAISNSTTLSHNWYQVKILLLFYPKIFGVHEQICCKVLFKF